MNEEIGRGNDRKRNKVLAAGLIAAVLLGLATKILFDYEIIEQSAETWNLQQIVVLAVAWFVLPGGLIYTAVVTLKKTDKIIGRVCYIIIVSLMAVAVFILVSLPVTDYLKYDSESLSASLGYGMHDARPGQRLIGNYSFVGVSEFKGDIEVHLSGNYTGNLSEVQTRDILKMDIGQSLIVDGNNITLQSLRYPAPKFRIRANFSIQPATVNETLEANLAKLPQVVFMNMSNGLVAIMLDAKGVRISEMRIKVDSRDNESMDQVWLNDAMTNNASGYRLNKDKDFIVIDLYSTDKEFPNSFIQIASIKFNTSSPDYELSKASYIVSNTLNTSKGDGLPMFFPTFGHK